jgi:hypothetical protein
VSLPKSGIHPGYFCGMETPMNKLFRDLNQIFRDMKTVDSNLVAAAGRATVNWMDIREYLGSLMVPEWKEAGIEEHMMREFIHNETPITARIHSLDSDNKAILFRALLKWYGDFPVEIIKY